MLRPTSVRSVLATSPFRVGPPPSWEWVSSVFCQPWGSAASCTVLIPIHLTLSSKVPPELALVISDIYFPTYTEVYSTPCFLIMLEAGVHTSFCLPFLWIRLGSEGCVERFRFRWLSASFSLLKCNLWTGLSLCGILNQWSREHRVLSQGKLSKNKNGDLKCF